jgi:hypothetical protein
MKRELKENGYRPEVSDGNKSNFELAYSGTIYGNTGEHAAHYFRESIFDKPKVQVFLHPCHPNYGKLMEVLGQHAEKVNFVAPFERLDGSYFNQILFNGMHVEGDPETGKFLIKEQSRVMLPERYAKLADKYPSSPEGSDKFFVTIFGV